jgi:hypothetical protein
MSIKKVGMKWYSDLLPNAEFESPEEARHFDSRAALQINAAQDQLKDAGVATASLPALIKAAMAVANASDKESQLAQRAVVEQFLAETPELIQVGKQGLHNKAMIEGFLRAGGIIQPTVYDYKRAYDQLSRMNEIFVKQ